MTQAGMYGLGLCRGQALVNGGDTGRNEADADKIVFLRYKHARRPGMPVVFRWKGCKFFFLTNEGDPRCQ